MKDRIDNLSHEYFSLIEAEVRLDVIMIRENFRTGLGQIMHIEDDQGMDKTIEVCEDMITIIEVVMGIIQEVIRGMEDRIIITIEGKLLKYKL